MPFNVYPDDATAALLGKPPATPVALAPNEAMRGFVPLAGHVGPDATQQGVPTCFIRIAVSGAPVGPGTHPKIELLAHDPAHGTPPPALDPNTAISIATAVQLYDDVNPTSAALVYFAPPFQNNVYLLKAAIEIAGPQLWIRITNTGGAARSFVWLVADSDADSQQPWIHVTNNGVAPAQLNFDVAVGRQAAQPLALTNHGTGSVTVADVNPALAAPFTVAGLPLRIDPNPSGPATVTINVQAASAGEFAAAAYSFVTSGKADPGPFGAGHDNQFILSAHIRAGNNWATKAPMPTAREAFGLALAGNGKLYAVGGVRSRVGDVLATVEEYDPRTDTWATKTPMPTARWGFGLVAAGNGKLYAVGGNTAGPGSDAVVVAAVEEYDPAANSWASRAAMPTVRWGLGLASASNGKIYAVGGAGADHAGSAMALVEEYDPFANHWATKSTMPQAAGGLAVAAANDGKLYAVWTTSDGFGRASVATTLAYDPASDSWLTRAAMPTPRSDLGLAAATNGRLYAVGGVVFFMRNVATVEEYDPESDTWTAKQPLATPRSYPGVAAGLDGTLYAIGGLAGADANASESAVVEQYTP